MEAEDGGETGDSHRPRPAVLLDNVRSAWNVGSIFRSAEGFGVRHLYLCGITATPQNAHVRKTALGAESVVPWSAHKDAVELVRQLKAQSHYIWALERTSRSVPLREAIPVADIDQVVLILGNEQAGVDPGILELADGAVHIEMHGRKRSFNVAVAFAVAAALLTEKR